MTEIVWREGVHDDRKQLQDFLCTPRAQKRPWGRSAPPRQAEWELVAQGGVRDLRPPARRKNIIVVGEDAYGLVAVAHAEQDGDESRAFVSVAAVALRRRGERVAGSTIGEQLLEYLIDRAANKADAAGHDHLVVWGKIDPRNLASKTMCSNLGFVHSGDEGTFEMWVTRVDFEDPL